MATLRIWPLLMSKLHAGLERTRPDTPLRRAEIPTQRLPSSGRLRWERAMNFDRGGNVQVRGLKLFYHSDIW